MDEVSSLHTTPSLSSVENANLNHQEYNNLQVESNRERVLNADVRAIKQQHVDPTRPLSVISAESRNDKMVPRE